MLSIRFVIPLILSLFMMTAYAEDFPDLIVLKSKLGNVTFTHQLHAFLEGIECSSCHHTEEGSDISQSCHQCHTETASSIPNARKAFHDQCIGCHKEDKSKGRPTGPTSECKACHVKE